MSWRADDGTFRVLAVASIEPRKGVHHLLEAFERAAIPKSELTLIGGTLMLLPLSGPATMQSDIRSISVSGILCILYMGIFTSIVAYLLWYAIMRRGSCPSIEPWRTNGVGLPPCARVQSWTRYSLRPPWSMA